MEEIRDSNFSTVINIAAAGDVFLIVGPEELKLRVQSVILKAASKPFSDMLGPNWKEGRDIVGAEEPVELLLPEDNAVGLKYICAITHHQNKMVPGNMAVQDILGIAAIVDKYDFIDAFAFASSTWLDPQDKEFEELMVLVVAAYLFRNAQAFKAITKTLVLNYGGSSYLALWSQDLEPLMKWKVICLLEEHRSFAKLKLAEILISGVNTGGCCHRCGWSSKYAFAYVQQLESKSLWPTSLVCISDAIDRAEKMPDPVPTEESASCRYGYKHTVPEYRSERQARLDDLRNRIGLCLQCVLLGEPSSGNCGITHEH